MISRRIQFLLLAVFGILLSLCARPIAPDGGEWQDPSRLSLGKLPPSSIPAPHHAIDLSGVESWRFKWSRRPSLRPIGFEKLDFDVSSWDLVTVPCSWQASGIRKSGKRYGVPLYVNLPYTFTPAAPDNTNCLPKVIGHKLPSDWTLSGEDNPVGSYRRDFELPSDWFSGEIFIRFEGVESFYYLWINGQYVGFAKDSRSPSVYNITQYVRPGKNVVAAEVYRYCDGSYLECQDAFRLSGIIRPVLVYRLNKGSLKDVRFHTCPERKGVYEGDWVLSFEADRAAEFKVFERGGSEVGVEKIADGKWRVKKPKLWSAEEPNLYTLVTEGISFNLGFRQVEITEPGNPRDRTFLINGKPVKLKGINRSEISPDYGHHCPSELLRKDIEIIKKGNFNHIRNSHCPQPDEFYDLCDEYGIYVMDEANLESHGMRWFPNHISGREEWFQAHVDRQVSMVKRNFNHPCVIMWSLGNEAGSGEAFKHCYDWIKKNDPTRPINYERNNHYADFGSRQYPDANWLRATAAGIENVKYPFHVNEFLHNLNNGAGSIKNFQDIIESSDRIFGSAIWDFADQGLTAIDSKTGKKYFAFGGDFGEKPNEGQGMLDGIVHADRSLEPAYYEARHAYQPFDCRLDGDKTSIVIESKYYFRDSSAYDVRINGKVVSMPLILPRSRRIVTFNEIAKLLNVGDIPKSILIEFVQREQEGFFEPGWVISSDQIFLDGAFKPIELRIPRARAFCSKTDNELTFNAGRFTYVFSRKTGSLKSLCRDGVEQISGEMVLDVMRGPVGGDMSVGGHLPNTLIWKSGLFGLRRLVPTLKSITDVKEEGGALHFATIVDWRGARSEEFRQIHRSSPKIVDVGEVPADAPSYRVATKWMIFADGTLVLDAAFKQFGEPFEVSRVGYRIPFKTSKTKVDYLAAGPWDNYADRMSGSFIGKYSQLSTEFLENYGRTSDCGNRMHAYAVRLDAIGLTFAGVDAPMAAFTVNPYSPTELIENPHPELLPAPQKTELGLYAAQRGLGSKNCGPPPEMQYVIDPKSTLRLKCVITPGDELALRTLPDVKNAELKNAKLPQTKERMIFPLAEKSLYGGNANLRTSVMRFCSEYDFWKFDGSVSFHPMIIWLLISPAKSDSVSDVLFIPNLRGNHEFTSDLAVDIATSKLSDDVGAFIVGGKANSISRGRLDDPSLPEYLKIREKVDGGSAVLTCCVRDVFSEDERIDMEWLTDRAREYVDTVEKIDPLKVKLDTSLCKDVPLVAMNDSPANPQELEFVRRRIEHIATIPGTPESDAFRFYSSTQRNEYVEFNYDESKAGVLGKDYKLEDPFTFIDGKKVKTKSDWDSRRKEILEMFEREVYGRLPPKPQEMVFEILDEKISPDSFAILRRYRQYFRKDKTGPVIDWFAAIPRYAKKPCPVFLHLNYAGLDEIEAKRTNHFDLPWDMLVANGYSFMSANYTQITGDGKTRGGFFNGVCRLWGERDFSKTDNPGSLIIWAWALMRGLDLAENMPEIDDKRNVVIGSSRLGKAALLAAAYDERFAVCAPNQTGAIGVQLMKRDYGESLKGQDLAFRHWYCRNVWKYADNPRSQPFDQHLLLACVAPRNLLLQCYHKKWFDPKGEFLAAKAAAPVWEFLTGKTLEAQTLPEAYDETYLFPPFGYATRTGSHGLSPYDWKWALEFAEKVFKK